MAPLDELTRLTLHAAAPYGFVLAGGNAMVAHQLVARPTEDLDLFTNIGDTTAFDQAVVAITEACEQAGYTVTVRADQPQYKQLLVAGPTSSTVVRIDLGYDWRAQPPTMLSIGPVLAADDAVASKVCALFGRGEVRDYIDVHAALTSSRYTRAELIELASARDPGFSETRFAEALAAIVRHSDEDFAAYGLTAEQIAALRDAAADWAAAITEPHRPS